jgi:tRNA nucleotidyltransferase (CCA-adding enzyme)
VPPGNVAVRQAKGGVTVARPGHAYPQARVLARDLVSTILGPLPPAASVREALARATRLDAMGFVLAEREGFAVLREDLRRAAALGLGDLPAMLIRRPLPVLDDAADELAVRRTLAGGAPLVLIRNGTTSAGAVVPRGRSFGHALGPSLTRRLTAALDRPARRLLGRVASLAEGHGSRAFAVGGVVRDAVRGAPGRRPGDLDVVVEGDGLAVAGLLAAETGGELVEHAPFLTASVRGPGERRVDIATARAEHYEAPGALPRVRPSTIGEDLKRRDFTVNAMAAELGSPAFLLVDPLGGRSDLRERRLRVLHPLSFVDDPTRLFRAARYAIRLGLTLDPWTAECQRLAVDQAPFDALSGARLLAELKRVLDEANAARALGMLGAQGAFRLLDRGYRYTPSTGDRVQQLASTLTWIRAHTVPVTAVDVLVLVLLADQTPRVAAGALRRLGLGSSLAASLLAIVGRTDALPSDVRTASTRSAAGRALRGRASLELAWLWLNGDAAVRRTVTRFVDRDAGVRPWLSGEEVIALGIPRGPGVARVLDELRDGRLDRTLAGRAAARRHVRRRASETRWTRA